MEQPNPIPNNNIPIVDLVFKDLEARKQKGIKTYGCVLTANNGRSALWDLYEELLDACCYIRQAIEEQKK